MIQIKFSSSVSIQIESFVRVIPYKKKAYFPSLLSLPPGKIEKVFITRRCLTKPGFIVIHYPKIYGYI